MTAALARDEAFDGATGRTSVCPLKTLAVDDDPVSREMLARILRRHGHVALSADSAESGLELCFVLTAPTSC